MRLCYASVRLNHKRTFVCDFQKIIKSHFYISLKLYDNQQSNELNETSAHLLAEKINILKGERRIIYEKYKFNYWKN